MTLGYLEQMHGHPLAATIPGLPGLPNLPSIPTSAAGAQRLFEQQTGVNVPTSAAGAQRLFEQQTGVVIPTSAAGAQRLIEQQTGVRIPTSGADIERMARDAVSAGSRQLRRQAERQLTKEAGKLAVRIAGPEAEKIKNTILKAMKVPGNIPIPIPTEFTAKGVKDAVLDAGASYVENAIQQQTGLPITLPRTFSAKAIAQAVGGIIPSDALEALELGITIGIQYASAAVAAMIGGAIGSVIPGLGTIIGIGMALGVQAIKDALKEPPVVEPCKAKFPINVTAQLGHTYRLAECPALPAASAMDLLPWLATHVAPMHAKLKRMDSKPCHGPLQFCASIFMTVSAKAYHVSKNTPQVLGLYQVNKFVTSYQKAMLLPRSRATDDMKLLMPKLLKRQKKLQALVTQANMVERLTASQRASLRWNIVTEFKNAGAQFAVDQGQETTQWLRKLGDYIRRLEASDAAFLQERKVRKIVQQQRYEQAIKDPAKVRAHALQQLRFKCGQGDQGACSQYRTLAAQPIGAGTPAQRPTPVSRPTPARVGTAARSRGTGIKHGRRGRGGSGIKQLETQVRRTGNAMLNAWLAQNPAQARCLTPRNREKALTLFIKAHAKKTMSVPAATTQIMAILNRRC